VKPDTRSTLANKHNKSVENPLSHFVDKPLMPLYPCSPLGTAPIARSHAGLLVLNRNRATTLWDARRNRRAVSRASRHAGLR
jgi:hypothetical protein